MGDIPRPEHPRPDWRRPDEWWLNLNGPWEFAIDRSASGSDRGYVSGRRLGAEITVPFCPESRLSGIEDRDFLNCVWYRRQVHVPARWAGRVVLLHIGACDYDTTVWLNGRCVGRHTGGYTPITCDLTGALAGEDTCELVVRAVDDIRCGWLPSGKQSLQYASHGCFYTRTTGIWQTVWLEAVPRARVRSARVYPDVARGAFVIRLQVVTAGPFEGRVAALHEGREVGHARFSGAGSATAWAVVDLQQPLLWSPRSPSLYRLDVALESAGERDEVQTWAGLREVRTDGRAVTLNGEPLFLRTVLDQGFYPDGVYTAPSAHALEADVDASLSFGFNGARLHQKVFEPLYLHLCDRKGYLVFGEFPDWPHAMDRAEFARAMMDQWPRAVARDLNHPSIIGWCPLNETGQADRSRHGEWLTRSLYGLTKELDPCRPVIDASGWMHFHTDIWDTHNYCQDVAEFASAFQPLARGEWTSAHNAHGRQVPYDGSRPYFVSEFGGIAWAHGDAPDTAWGYGSGPTSPQEFLDRFDGLVGALRDNPGISGFCYTQLTDVEQEINGLMTYDRRPKFPPARIARTVSGAPTCDPN
jgi:beta-galactosidase/beta-glucuronidase